LKGTPLDPARLTREHLKPALTAAGITKPFRPFHDLRHTALTHEAAAGKPLAYIQMRAGHSQSSITERYIHAAQVQFAGAADRSQQRLFSATESDARLACVSLLASCVRSSRTAAACWSRWAEVSLIGCSLNQATSSPPAT
jgi:hypothetical protein